MPEPWPCFFDGRRRGGRDHAAPSPEAWVLRRVVVTGTLLVLCHVVRWTGDEGGCEQWVVVEEGPEGWTRTYKRGGTRREGGRARGVCSMRRYGGSKCSSGSKGTSPRLGGHGPVGAQASKHRSSYDDSWTIRYGQRAGSLLARRTEAGEVKGMHSLRRRASSRCPQTGAARLDKKMNVSPHGWRHQ